MSRFFATGSDSESDSGESTDQEIAPARVAIPTKTFQFSDDEEETKRVVRSAKDKRFDELKDVIKHLKNHKKIKDMANVLTDFEALGKAYDKAKKVVEKEGVIPRFYVRCLVELEDFVNECWEDREARKQMSKNNAKGLTTLRQKLRKYIRDFETEIAGYRENPDKEDDASGDEEQDYGGSESEDEKEPEPEPKMEAEESDSDDSIWSSDSTDSSSSSDDDVGYENLAAKFLKKNVGAEEAEAKERKRREKREKRARAKEEREGEWEEVQKGAPLVTEKPKMFSKDAEINHDAVMKKLSEIVSARGKKGTDRTEMINLLTELRTIAAANNLGPAMDMKIAFNIIAAIFDYNPNIATHMRSEMWEQLLNLIEELLNILMEHPSIIASENMTDDSEKFDAEPYRVRGCILTVVERMDEEFTKMLQGCDAHSTEYVERLKDEQKVCQIIETLQKYLEGRATTEETCRVYLRRIEHVYYKCYSDSKDLMEKLCQYIYAKDNTDRIRTRAMLAHIYHHAIHDRWFEARDLMLMSHLQDNIQHSDVATQIMYNRAMVQLGLCAFRQGMIKDAHNCLVDIQSGGRAKELLAQGLLLQRQHERTPEQEKIEKRRQMPYHMHINLELLECVYLVSAMLLEIPYMAAHEFDARRRLISKNFHHVLRVSDRQPLVGPPESMREHVVAASKVMKTGDWKACKNFIINEKMKAKVWDLFHGHPNVHEMVTRKIQEESLRTYLFTYSSVYDSLSLVTLAEMFELEKPVVHSIISKMIINEELMASLDEPTQSVVMHRTEPTRLQSLALQLSEKVSSLVECNEKLLEMKQGNYFFQKGGQYNRDGQQQNWGGKRDDRQQGWGGKRDDRQQGWGGKRDDRQQGWGGKRDRGDGQSQGWKGNRDRGDRDRGDNWGRRNQDNRRHQRAY